MRQHYYLDNASTSWPKPEEVYRAMADATRSLGASPGRGQYALCGDADRLVTETRELLASFFNHNGGAERVIFAHNGTDALNVALFGFLEEGDHVVTTRLEHNSVLRPLLRLRECRNVNLTFVEMDPSGYVRLDSLRRAVSAKTKAVVLNHGSNVLGSVQDLEAVSAITRAAGTRLIVDASQTAGVCEIDMEALGIDLLAFAGHKSLFGPMGIAGLAIGAGVDLAPLRHGGTGVDSSAPQQPERYPYRLEAGTLPLPAIVGLNAGLKWFSARGRDLAGEAAALPAGRQLANLAIRSIQSEQRRHRRHLEQALRDLEGVVVYGPTSDQPTTSTLAFNVVGHSAEMVAGVLDADFHVCVRAGLHCAPLVHVDLGTLPQFGGAVRLSPGLFTDEEDLSQAIHGIGELACLNRRSVRHGWNNAVHADV